jgi:hypothetical protein
MPKPRRPSGPLIVFAVSSFLLLGLLTLGSGDAAQPPAGSAPLAASHTVPLAAVAVHVGHPLSSASPAPFRTVPPALPGATATLPWNCTPVNVSTYPITGVPDLGVNFTVATTPANGTGAAPLNFTWNITFGGGGLPPFHSWIYLDTASQSLSSFQPVGNLTLSEAGIWSVDVVVEDASCTQFSGAFFSLMAWNVSLGPQPVVVSSSATTAALPADVTFTLSAPAVPTGWSVFWSSPGFYPYTLVENHTFYLPGTYNETACLVEPDGTEYSCGTSANVNVTGASPIQTAVTVASGPYPENVTFWANVTNASSLPIGTSLYLYAWNGTGGNWVQTSNSSVNLTESVGCGYPWTKWVVPTGNCTETAELTLWGGPNGSYPSTLGIVTLSVNLTANGSPVNWWPSVSYTYGPTNGSAPLNVTINVSAVNGLGPYTLSWVVIGDSGNGTHSTLFNESYASLYPWNGTLQTLTLPLDQVGYYWIAVEVVASNFGYVTFSLPLVVVGNATVAAFAPLSVNAAETNSTAAGRNGSSPVPVQFVATPEGGVGPYTVQWSFGDGQFASSVPGVAIQHRYTSAGTFVPTVTVVDARGAQATTTLPSITVPQSSGTSPHGSGTPNGSGTSSPGQRIGPTSSPAASGTAEILLAVIAGAFIIAGLLLSRREFGREGEALVAGLEPDGPKPPVGPSK